MLATKFLTKLYKVFKRVFGRRAFFVILSALLQILWFVLFFMLLGYRYPFLAGVVRVVSLVIVLLIVNRRQNPSYKLTWAVIILAVPMIGFALYLLFGRPVMRKRDRLLQDELFEKGKALVNENPEDHKSLEEENKIAARQSAYIRDRAYYPVYRHTQSDYFSMGERLYDIMKAELEKAEHFIFLEFFIIDDGEMWSTILDILERKAAAGVDVRLIYDAVGCINTLPARFDRELKKRGIKCVAFNPFKTIISVVLNNRDHRKIVVIDGHTAFTGGINLADEYINRKTRFGRWKDSGIMIRGEAVWNFTIMFLQMWGYVNKDPDELSRDNVRQFTPHRYHPQPFENDGFVQPYADTPLDNESVGENVYLQIISHATRYVYIFTPYLIIDNEMMTTLCLAAKSGVDVRIVTPGIPDKKLVNHVTKAYYGQLLDAGVKILEYEPGFVHAKCFVCDDRIATVGTINLDYRSLYLHFECGVWMYDTQAVRQVRSDALRTISQCREIKKKAPKSRIPNLLGQIWVSVMRLIAPIL